MTSICAWRFSHMAADIEKLRSSTISRNATRTGHALTLKFTGHCLLEWYALSGQVLF